MASRRTVPTNRSAWALARGHRGGHQYDVAVVGGRLAGLATSLRPQARGLSTVVLEAHGHADGCVASRFDVGAATLVDFEP